MPRKRPSAGRAPRGVSSVKGTERPAGVLERPRRTSGPGAPDKIFPRAAGLRGAGGGLFRRGCVCSTAADQGHLGLDLRTCPLPPSS